jgi:hypothetical protein
VMSATMRKRMRCISTGCEGVGRGGSKGGLEGGVRTLEVQKERKRKIS